MQSINPVISDFIIFCAKRCGNRWPALYDEMSRVSARRLFKGLGYEDLRMLGLSLSLHNIEHIASMVDKTLSQIPGDKSGV